MQPPVRTLLIHAEYWGDGLEWIEPICSRNHLLEQKLITRKTCIHQELGFYVEELCLKHTWWSALSSSVSLNDALFDVVLLHVHEMLKELLFCSYYWASGKTASPRPHWWRWVRIYTEYHWNRVFWFSEKSTEVALSVSGIGLSSGFSSEFQPFLNFIQGRLVFIYLLIILTHCCFP